MEIMDNPIITVNGHLITSLFHNAPINLLEVIHEKHQLKKLSSHRNWLEFIIREEIEF